MRQLHASGRFLRRDDALLGVVGQYPETGRQDVAVRIVLLGLRDRRASVRDCERTDGRLFRWRRMEFPRKPAAGIGRQSG